MQEHALDLLHVAIWVIVGIGTVGVGVMSWGGKKVLARLDEIEALLASEVKALRDMQHHIDVRLTRVEERCQIVLSKGMNHDREE